MDSFHVFSFHALHRIALIEYAVVNVRVQITSASLW